MEYNIRGRCGLCCTLLVRITDKDIARLIKTGYPEIQFVDKNSAGETVLKRVNSYCVFLEIQKGVASCTVYPSRPKICREYECIKDGEEQCRLQRHFTINDLTEF